MREEGPHNQIFPSTMRTRTLWMERDRATTFHMGALINLILAEKAAYDDQRERHIAHVKSLIS